MKILNIRLGLATNSSSTHSVIFLPKGMKAEEIQPDDPNCFGWSYFQLTNKNSKMDYLAQSLYTQLIDDVGADIAETVSREWTGGTVNREGYVDHQSTLTFPREWSGKGLDREFVNEFKQFLLSDNIAIGGGNDNDDGVLPAVEAGALELSTLPLEHYSESFVARKDPSGYWTIFNRKTGAKFRLSLDTNSPGVTTGLLRSAAPELVDVKITDYCPFGCAFCYQDSTLSGSHGNAGWIHSLVYKLQQLRVFEVAIGGGEPTLHPDFVDILRDFRNNGIVPNFTTKSLGWLRDEKQRTDILAHAGAFAFSADTAKEVEDLITALPKDSLGTPYGTPTVCATIQHVIGVAEEPEFRKILNICAKNCLPVTLLGYKQVGRGPQFGVKSSAKWLKIVSAVAAKHPWFRIGIDTALADRHWDELLEAGVPEQCLTRTEGQFSCYVDAVAQTLNTSSYTKNPGITIQDIYQTDLAAIYRDLPRE
jgi:hypothetical protein